MTLDSAPEPAPSGGGARRFGGMAAALLLTWIALACAAFLLTGPPPEPPAVDPQDQEIRARMADWAVRDADQWEREAGDQTIPWDKANGHLAIVIDDVGRELDAFDKLLALRYPLSFSVLPGSIYAAGVQDRLRADHRRPREILLHLPMEPLDPSHMSQGDELAERFLRAEDSPATLRAKVQAALSAVPHAVGVNNHMGSKLTADSEAMAAIMPELRERGLYFLDSRTNPETLAAIEARRAGVPTLSRKVFLDHEPGKAAIRRSLFQAAELARGEPTLAIAHPSMDVVEVLREELPALHAQGVGIYSASQLLEARR